jgi:Protein of unknown function (DUF3024)
MESSVTLSLLELQRARKQLKVYCDNRNRGKSSATGWSAREMDECFLISRRGRFDSKGRALPEQMLLKLCYRGEVWQLFLPRAQGDWLPYPPRPEVENFDQVLRELDQAPLHVHW